MTPTKEYPKTVKIYAVLNAASLLGNAIPRLEGSVLAVCSSEPALSSTSLASMTTGKIAEIEAILNISSAKVKFLADKDTMFYESPALIPMNEIPEEIKDEVLAIPTDTPYALGFVLDEDQMVIEACVVKLDHTSDPVIGGFVIDDEDDDELSHGGLHRGPSM